VFRNLILNALQAMPRGGELHISRRVQDGGCIITFHDQGPGFSQQALARGAELFFSEKEGGMGVGLNVAQEILSAHGGRLTLNNPPQGGAQVIVTFPLEQGVGTSF
jgi:signal transduction histidine kinase